MVGRGEDDGVAGRVRRSCRATGREGTWRLIAVRVMVGVAGVEGNLEDWPMRACCIVGGGGDCMIG